MGDDDDAGEGPGFFEGDRAYSSGATAGGGVVGNHDPVYLRHPYGVELPPPFLRSLALGEVVEEN